MQSRTPTFDEEQRNSTDNSISFSNRERQILTLIAEGRTDNEIAIELVLSAATVSWHVWQIRTRLDARSRAHAVALAIRQGLLPGKRSPEQHP